jgi:ubiquinone/menaquinone biosynthesis C-methylase UbiE
MIDHKNKYTEMQRQHYDSESLSWNINHRDPVVGFFDMHNSWKDYDEYLFKDISTDGKIALDFGCGPGRNIVKFSHLFDKIDGVDISKNNLDNALLWCEENNVKTMPSLFQNNGIDLSCISGDGLYDIVFSTICLQHICVHDIRYSILSEFHRVLKSDGYICLQMGFGGGHPSSRDYYDNFWDAHGTNSACDTRVDSPDQLKDDLYKIGFKDFSYDICPAGPGDQHNNWIFFRASK